MTARIQDLLPAFDRIASDFRSANQTAEDAGVTAADAKLRASVFPSVNAFLETPLPVDIVAVRARAGNETLGWMADANGPILAADGNRYRPDGYPKPQHFGAAGNGVADDSDALDAWSIYVDALRMVAPQVIEGPAGRYRLTRPLKFIRSASSGYRAQFDLSAMELICDFNRDEYPAFIEFGDRANPSVYQAQYDFSGRILLRRGPNCQYAPVGIEIWGMAQSQLTQIDTSSWNNCLLVTHGPQNVTFRDLIFYSGGWCFGFKNPGGMTVTWDAAGALAIVGGTGVFDASWIGKTISLHTSETAYHVKITAVSSPTAATADRGNPVSGTPSTTAARTVRTGSCAVTTTAGSPVVTLDGDDPVGDHLVGLLVGIPRAGTNGKILVAKVIGANAGARTLTLDRNAAVTLNPVANPLTDTTEIATPVVATLSDIDTGIHTNGISQVRFYNCQFETFRGLAMLFDDAELVDFFGCKFHGVETNYTWNVHAIGAIWANRLGGKFYGEVDARYYGQYRFRFADQTQSFTFHHLAGRMATFEKLVHVAPMFSAFEAAVAAFGTVSMLGCADGAGFSTLVVDENTLSAGYHPPSVFIKPDHNDIKSYCGPLHRFERTAAFSLAGGKFFYNATDDVVQSNSLTRVFGQTATIEIKDSDTSGFTYLRFRDVLGNDRAAVRTLTDDGTMDLMVQGAARLSATPRGIAATVPVYADNAAALAGGLLSKDIYRTATGELRVVL